ncbi:UDP-N-acetylglucosamine--N-acetylmuramyl-(pentapeptide) pyrophosphoryl-undecaprenol N-acetylglucosamine transferase [Candidatus Parcubacteria bacterium]|jgi:UDP-N-acetylglucosamine--N-acetylmuramyl-(pentapeptide) pyrophosphoryl-undecaprenol N-acetylglucosamine transferase|nr:UDP-N-acetylglucosamine--N-acetylmuramyl-(pentapeptide) pyrophosphoryl-undecaprenol N-acetylglucosamine transferase [Candidatus Parcubacteria bacterium]
MSDKKPKIILAGGGTLGSVSPLLAIASKYQADYLFIGSDDGPEKKIIEDKHIEFLAIKSGKLRRYFDWKNFADIIKIKLAFWQSLNIINKFKPDIVLTAGSFVAVPVVWAAWILRVPVIVHQQDIKVGLANKLMAPFAKKITVTFKEQVSNFKHNKVVITGNPVRKMQTEEVYKPIVVITGGGLGARRLNNFVALFIPKLLEKYEVHHILGDRNWDQKLELDGYYPYKFIKRGMLNMLSQADIVISRAGMSLITEVAALKKALVLIPIPDSHQERNAAFFAKKNAAIMVKQGSDKIMGRYLDKLMESDILRTGLANNLHQAFPKYAVNDYIILINKILNKE